MTQPGTPQPATNQQPGITIRGRRFGLPWMIGGVVAVLVILTCGCCGTVTLASALNGGGKAVATATTGQSAVPATRQATHAPVATATPRPKPTATPKPQPKVVLKLSGNGDKSSQTFTVSGAWQIAWTCSGVPSSLDNAPLYINVYNASDNSENFGDDVSYNCPNGKGGGDSSVFHDGGTFYLKTITGIDWTITVSDLPD